MAGPVLQADDVTVRYPGGVEALRAASLSAEAGETVALVGESGSGKTTLLRLFNRMVRPTAGAVRVRGRDVAGVDPVELRRHTGYVQQEGGLLPHWTVERNVRLVPDLLGWDAARARSRARDLLELVGLDPDVFGGRYPRRLSGGQRQRVAIARALAADPDVVLLDEPFGALDAITRLELQDRFLELKRRVGKTMVFVTHDLDEAFRLADRVAVLKDGEVLQDAPPAELRSAPRAGYVAELLRKVAR